MSKGIIGIVDGDILIYRACHRALKHNLDVTSVFDDLYDDLQEQMACSEYSLHISGTGNFRKNIKQGFTKYKGTRKTKPTNYNFIRDYVVKKYDTVTVPLYEADDTACIEGTKYLKDGQLFMVATVDKDWKMIGGLFYNMQYKSLTAIGTIEAVEYFHHQLITGDSVDNIPGLFGLGKKKAEKILNGKDIKGQFEAIIKTYKTMHPDDYVERLNVMGTLLYLVKDYDDEKWNIEYWNRYLNEITNTTKV